MTKCSAKTNKRALAGALTPSLLGVPVIIMELLRIPLAIPMVVWYVAIILGPLYTCYCIINAKGNVFAKIFVMLFLGVISIIQIISIFVIVGIIALYQYGLEGIF